MQQCKDIDLENIVKNKVKERNEIKVNLNTGLIMLEEVMVKEKSITKYNFSVVESLLASAEAKRNRIYFDNHDKDITKIMRMIDDRVWLSVFEEIGIIHLMTLEAKEEFSNKVLNGEYVFGNEENIIKIVGDFLQNKEKLVSEKLYKIFREISWNYPQQNPILLGKTITVEVSNGNHPMQNKTDILDSLMQVFMFLENLPITNNGEMYELVYNNLPTGTLNTAYFSMKLYKNGSGKIEFSEKTLPLIERCNEIMLKNYPNALPYGKK